MALLRIQPFLARLENEPIEAVCTAEVEYLRGASKSTAGLKTALSQYRNALRKIDPEHPAIGKLRMMKTELSILGDHNSKQRSDRQRRVHRITDVDGYLNYCESVLNATHYIDRLLALAALTGRRTSELLCSARLEQTGEYEALFSGQLKTKDRETAPYPIPLLTDFDTVADALERLQSGRPDLWGEPKRAERRTSKAISMRIKRLEFGQYLELSRGTIIGRDLRRAYGAIAFETFCDDDRITQQKYISDVLGHGHDDDNTGGSYMDFKVIAE